MLQVCLVTLLVICLFWHKTFLLKLPRNVKVLQIVLNNKFQTIIFYFPEWYCYIPNIVLASRLNVWLGQPSASAQCTLVPRFKWERSSWEVVLNIELWVTRLECKNLMESSELPGPTLRGRGGLDISRLLQLVVRVEYWSSGVVE